MRFQAGNVHESASLFNLKEKKFDTEDGRIRTHDPDGAVYYANHQTTEDLLESGVFKYIWHQPQPKNKNLTCFETVFNPNQ